MDNGNHFYFRIGRLALKFLMLMVEYFFILTRDVGSGEVSLNEFQTLGFLFSFTSGAIKRIYDEFHIAGRQELDQADFQLFVLAAVEMQSKLDKRTQLDQESGNWKERLNEFITNLKYGK